MAKEKKILIVDDEKDLCMVLEKILTSRGYVTESVFDGKSALEKTKKNGNYSLVLLDLKLPRLPGEKVFARMREVSPKTKVFIMTGHGTVDSAVGLMKKGVSQYLQKPFDNNHLLELVEKEIGPGDQARQERILCQGIGERIRSLREKEGLTIQQLGQRTSLSTSLISQVENGKISPSLSTLLTIAGYFRTPIRNFF